jgi:hypothetical protein
VTTFSDKAFFKTVFISGDDMVAEMEATKKKEAEDWKSKVVVKNTHFAVNTVIPVSQQTDKFRDIRSGGIKKIGYRLSPQRVKQLNERQIVVAKGTPIPPVN